MTRKKRKSEYTCTCLAYRFPHRMLGGKCKGLSIVQEYWDEHYGGGDCTHCMLFDEQTTECQVLSGQEEPIQCPVLGAFIHYHEIKVL